MFSRMGNIEMATPSKRRDFSKKDLIPIMMMEWRYERFCTRRARLPSKTSMNISKLFLMFMAPCPQKVWSQPSGLSSALFSSINWRSSTVSCKIRTCASASKLCSKLLRIYVHASIKWEKSTIFCLRADGFPILAYNHLYCQHINNVLTSKLFNEIIYSPYAEYPEGVVLGQVEGVSLKNLVSRSNLWGGA